VNMRAWPEYVQRLGYDMSTLNGTLTNSTTTTNGILISTNGTNDTNGIFNGTFNAPGMPAVDINRPTTDTTTTTTTTTTPTSSVSGTGMSAVGIGRVRCVGLIRDPLSRLRSLYAYARSGGEHWFRYGSGTMQKLSDPSISLLESIELFWSLFGKAYLIQSHDYMMMNIQLGCVPIKMEAFTHNYTQTMREILQVYGIHSRAIPTLLQKFKSSDNSLKTESQQKADAHVTANKFSGELIKNVNLHLMQIDEVKDMVLAHREELGYNIIHV
jgi:hypothetical protein